MNDKEFIGRNREIEEFKEFLTGERPNWGDRGKGAPLLLVVGDKGIGKRSLLQEMARRADEQEHYVIARPVDENLDFDKQIYSLIAMAKRNKRLHWKGIDLFEVGLKLLDIAEPRVRKLVDLVRDTLKEHEKANYDENYLAQMLHSALSKLDGKMGGAQRIVVLLYPKTKSPARLIPLLEYIQGEMKRKNTLPKVRFVIAQRPNDAVIEAARKREPQELQEICAEPMKLGMMEPKDSLEFIEVYDAQRKLNEAMRKVFLERYGGWPLAMELGLEQLPEKGEITEEDIRSLPPDIRNFWRERYEKVDDLDSRNFLQTVNLLPHRYLKDDVALFAKLEPDSMELASSDDSPVWRLLVKRDYDELYSGDTWEDCPDPKHPTTRDYVIDRLKTKHKALYHKRLDAIISHYKVKVGADFEKADRDTLAYLFPYMITAESWDEIDKLLTNIGYLKRKQKPEEQHYFQNDFINLLRNKRIPNNKLVNILEGVLNAICEKLPTSKEKADWLDTFAYWVNEFGVKDDTERSLALKDVARKFDYACGDVSKELAEDYREKGDNDWALRFAELRTWVYQRAGDYDKCADACRDAEKMCKGMEDAYGYLGQAEFIRLRAHALTKLSKIATDESKKTEYKAMANEAYEELNKVFPAEKGESQWPTIKEWKELEELLEKNTDEVLTPPSQARSDKSRAFRAKVISNLDDCVSAMHIIQFFEEHDGLVEWIHHKKFEPEQFAPEDTLFTVLVGGPKAPGISKVAYEFFETDKERFLQMYSGLVFGAHCLKITKGKTHCYMLGGISKVNTLKAAYEFTKDAEVME